MEHRGRKLAVALSSHRASRQMASLTFGHDAPLSLGRGYGAEGEWSEVGCQRGELRSPLWERLSSRDLLS